MAELSSGLPAGVQRVSGLYHFIPPQRFSELGIDPEDVPLGTFPAENHPRFLPDRFGGNAYGLGLFEIDALTPEQAAVLENIDFDDAAQLSRHHRLLNDIMKRLGLLIRFSRLGKPFYLIPQQFVANLLVELQAKRHVIAEFLKGLNLSSELGPPKVGILTREGEPLLLELHADLPHVDFVHFTSLSQLANAPRSFLQALILEGAPKEFLPELTALSKITQEIISDYGWFTAGKFHDILENNGKLLVLWEYPQEKSEHSLTVRFKRQDEFKRFLLFSHVYRTYRRYRSSEGMSMKINALDFQAFLSGRGIYHETMEGLLGGRSMPQVNPAEIDGLPYHDQILPRPSIHRTMRNWSLWFGTFFRKDYLGGVLPDAQREAWAESYEIAEELPQTLLVFKGTRISPPVLMDDLEVHQARGALIGCDRALLAPYKNSFAYVGKVLYILQQIKNQEFAPLHQHAARVLGRALNKNSRHAENRQFLRMLTKANRFGKMESRFNPGELIGPHTPVLENLEKLSLMGFNEEFLGQLYLTVLGHSTMSRVSFGKLPEISLTPLTNLLEEVEEGTAIRIIRLFLAMSVAESAAASDSGLSRQQQDELFQLSVNASRVAVNPDLTWQDVVEEQIQQFGGVRALGARKLLKLFGFFEFLDLWQQLAEVGPYQQNVLTDYDNLTPGRSREVIELINCALEFEHRYYAAELSSRSFFFEAFLGYHLHGSVRLLSQLGPQAGFTLIWICVHAGERRLLNFNRLLEVEDHNQWPAKLAKLRQTLLALSSTENILTPAYLTRSRQALSRRERAYISDSGLYLYVDQFTGALTPVFVDAPLELDRLRRTLSAIENKPLLQATTGQLRDLNSSCQALLNYLRAMRKEFHVPPDGPDNDLSAEFKALRRRTMLYLADQLFIPENFSYNLDRLSRFAPFLLRQMLPPALTDLKIDHRLRMARKLSALFVNNFEMFQDLKYSNEKAREEFGVGAAGIVGVSVDQFNALHKDLAELLAINDKMGLLLMLAVLLHQNDSYLGSADVTLPPLLAQRLDLSRRWQERLAYLLRHHELYARLQTGQEGYTALEHLLSETGQELNTPLFLLSMLGIGAQREGDLTEDRLEGLLAIGAEVRRFIAQRLTVRDVLDSHVKLYAKQIKGYEQYCDARKPSAPPGLNSLTTAAHLPSLEKILCSAALPAGKEQKELWLLAGRQQVAMERMYMLHQLLSVKALDVTMFRREVPVSFIYHRKYLRSQGKTNFAQDLHKAAELTAIVEQLPYDLKDVFVESLCSADFNLTFYGYYPVAMRLTPANRVRLLLLVILAGQTILPAAPLVHVSLLPLARSVHRLAKQLNQDLAGLGSLNAESIAKLLNAQQGLGLLVDEKRALITLNQASLSRLQSSISIIKHSNDLHGIKRLYLQEKQAMSLQPSLAERYGEDLDHVFSQAINRLADVLLEKGRDELSRAATPEQIQQVFENTWQEGAQFPLSQDRQNGLKDFLEINLERVRGQYLLSVEKRIAQTSDIAQLNDLWKHVREEISRQRHLWGREFEVMVAGIFDHRYRHLTD